MRQTGSSIVWDLDFEVHESRSGLSAVYFLEIDFGFMFRIRYTIMHGGACRSAEPQLSLET